MDPTTTTGSHRAIGKPRRRVAAWPIACVVLLALLVAGWFGWNWADGLVTSRAAAQATSCPSGDTAIRVLVAPSAEQPVTSAAKAWHEQDANVVHDHCVQVRVEAMPADKALDTLLAGGRPVPAAWMPERTDSVRKLTDTRPGLIGSSAESVAYRGKATYPYVTISADGIDDVQERAAQAFRAFLKQPAQRQAFNAAGLIQR